MLIGEILLNRNEISEAQLEDALQHQKYFPGKTGTQLVELGFVRLETLEQALSEMFRIPAVQDGQLENMDAFCRNQFPVEALEVFQVLPFIRHQLDLSVAMVNPHDQQALAWLREISGCRLKIYSLSEIRFGYFMFRLFRREINSRIRQVGFRYYKKKCQDQLLNKTDSAPAAKKLYFETDRRFLDELGLKPLAEGEELGAGELILPAPVQTVQVAEYEPEFADLSQL